MSREKKWTPGPWTVMGTGGITLIYGNTERCDRVARVMIMKNNIQRRANAALISAAPELVSELEEADTTICVMCKLLNPQHKDCTSCPDRESRLAALAKAYGETP